jgi:membrane protease YdiL (CAAX protease family)
MSALDGQPFPVSAVAKTRVTLASIDLSRRSTDALQRSTRNVLIAELRRYMANYVRASLDYRIDSLVKEAEFARYRSAVGAIVIAALSLLSFYTMSLTVLPRFEHYLEVNFALSPFIIMFFAAIFFPVIRWSGFPLAFFGIRLDNWKGAVLFSSGASLAFIAAGAILKWMIIVSSPSLKGMTVFSWADVSVDGKEVMGSLWYWIAVTLYLLLTPVQEFVARCGIQAPLYAFLQGSELKRRGLAIIVSNLVFSAAHTHIGLIFALATFIPGLFWGWIFARTNSLAAASLSHFLIGGAGIFLFGIEEFVQKLF